MSKQCCEWHDHLPEMYQSEATPEDSFDQCGLAGSGRPSVCCRECPRVGWFYGHYKMKPSDIDFTKEIMALPLEQRP